MIIAITGSGLRIKSKDERFLDKAFTHGIGLPKITDELKSAV